MKIGGLILCLVSLSALCTQAAFCQGPPAGTVLPTDIVPLPGTTEGPKFGENFKLKALKSLPSKFYFSTLVETSLRDETNVYQYPMRRQLLRKFASEPYLSAAQSAADAQTANLASKNDGVFRVLPNVTAGWAFTPRTRVYANYFMIRDSLFHNVAINTTIQSVGGGVQHDVPLGRRANLQFNAQFRELFQNKQPAVFDYLPTVTLTYAVNPRTIAYLSALLQMRGRHFAAAPTRELDPFYSIGLVHQRGYYTYSATGTFLQNFRQMFDSNALIPISNYAFVLDFEVAHTVIKKIPSLQAFVRAEPIYNLHSKMTPGLSGVDFRIFSGLRFGVSKPALTDALQRIQNQLQEREATPPPPRTSSSNSSNAVSKRRNAQPPVALQLVPSENSDSVLSLRPLVKTTSLAPSVDQDNDVDCAVPAPVALLQMHQTL